MFQRECRNESIFHLQEFKKSIFHNAFKLVKNTDLNYAKEREIIDHIHAVHKYFAYISSEMR